MMHELVVAAIASQDYKRAAQLLKQWQKAAPKDPLLMLQVARLQAETLQFDAAEKTYLKFLKRVNNPKLMGQARSGLKQVQQRREVAQQQALNEATAVLGSDDPGILVIASPADRQAAAQGLAKVLKIDPYTARMQLPSQGMRLQRIGSVGELAFYGKALQQVGIPAFWVKVEQIKALQTFRVQHVRDWQPQPAVVCASPTGQMGAIAFDWSEVTQRVQGQLPIFEQVADLGPWGKPKRKEKTQDYVQVLDLHLSQRGIVLRLCDRTYEFTKGTRLLPDTAPQQSSTRLQWNALLQTINSAVQGPCFNQFTSFGQGALEFIELLPYVNPYLDIDRRAPTHWDPAFHLYSSLLLLKHSLASSSLH
ncbi:MAG: tetratricopeptide repeat protein [Cyanobacteria bacterium P01_A01_bin.105]